MIRSLRTGISGIKSNQVRMDVVGNNIANVNTNAFKRSRTAFNEVLGQQLLGVGRTSGGTGINPSFVGLGVTVGSIDQNWGQGALENTGIGTDLALGGDGFFIARAGDRKLLTRAGNFTFNSSGNLVTASGLNVQGWAFNGGQLVTGALQDIEIDVNAQAPAKATSTAVVTGNLNADSVKPTNGGINTSISAVIYDEQGKAHNVIVEFTRTEDPNEWTYEINSDSAPLAFAPTSGTMEFDTNGDFKRITKDGVAAALYDAGPPVVGSPSLGLEWNADYVAPADAGPPAILQSITIDLSNMNQTSGSNTVGFREQNGSPSGNVVGYSFTPEGILRLNYSNGEQEDVYQLAIGAVNNPNGLEQQGENFYATTGASGDLQIGRAGRDLRTAVVAGTLEMSNVDLATEFAEMIIAQRGYQAAARIITTSDELLQETVQLKR